MSDLVLLSLTIFLPTLGAIALLAFDKKAEEAMRMFSLIITVATFGLSILILSRFTSKTDAQDYVGAFQLTGTKEWIPTWNVYYRLGVDGISLPLVLLTSLVSMLSMLASWSVQKQVRGF